MLKKSLLVGLVIASTASFAETTTSTTKVEAKKENKSDKADEVITNARMRASGGSLSKLSISTAFSYSGGSIEKPLAADRPNIAGANNNVALASLGGSIGASYRVSKLNRLKFSTGLSMVAPFNQTIDTSDKNAEASFNKNQGKLDIDNPGVSFSHINKFFGVQTVLSVSSTQYTTSSLRDLGLVNNTGVSVNSMYDFGGSPLSIGAVAGWDRIFFDKSEDGEGNDLTAFQGETSYYFIPQIEYTINDKFTLRTVLRTNIYENTRKNSNDFTQQKLTQSVGVGTSITRDIYLYPNVQFVPGELKAEKTNIGLTAYINMF